MESLVKMNIHEIYKNKKVFITGHSGFKGSWLTLWLQDIGAEVAGYSLEPEKLSHFNLLNLKSKNYFNDINDQNSLEKAILEFKPDVVFHLAAQPLVRDSYDDPVTTYNTNVTGSLKVYLAALKAKVTALVSITTDKVYENKEWSYGYREVDRFGGHDPYSASKACMEIMTESFKKSFLNDGQMLIATVRAGNVIGGGDWAKDRLVPDLIKNAVANRPTPIRSPNSIRPWQHVLDPLHGYLLVGERLLKGEKKYATSYNFGPDNAGHLQVVEVVGLAKKVWDKIDIKIEIVEGQRHEASILKLDTNKAYTELDWKPTWDATDSISHTVEWYKNYYLEKKVISLAQIAKFKK